MSPRQGCGAFCPQTCHTPLSHLRKVEVRLRPPSVERATTVWHINSSSFFSRNQLELEARPALYQRPRNCDQWMPGSAPCAPHGQTLVGWPSLLTPPTHRFWQHPRPSLSSRLAHCLIDPFLPQDVELLSLSQCSPQSTLPVKWVSEHATFLAESGGPTRLCASAVPDSSHG